jgi:hypothetical protein
MPGRKARKGFFKSSRKDAKNAKFFNDSHEVANFAKNLSVYIHGKNIHCNYAQLTNKTVTFFICLVIYLYFANLAPLRDIFTFIFALFAPLRK